MARKIAAGEVIDRPQAVLRELLDNALDAGATRLDISWRAGGLQALEVGDDGHGMSRADLELCWLPHTTSKIETEDDLERLRTLGFRGEALASIAACSRLTIRSGTGAGASGQVTLEDGLPPRYEGGPALRGTRITVEDLFGNLPARRKFLKSAAAEGTLCRRVLDERALAFPGVAFTLWTDGVRRVDYPAQTPGERVLAVCGPPWSSAGLLAWTHEEPGVRLTGYALKPPASRSDRKGVRVYANMRPLQDYALVQALCHAFEGYLPGGAYPHAVLMAEVDPGLVDFNIHPAKREARFRNASALHHAVVESTRRALEGQRLRFPAPESAAASPPGFSFGPPDQAPAPTPAAGVWDAVWEQARTAGPVEVREQAAADGFRYLGQVLGVFLLAERGRELYVVDQHAAHERLLFDAFRARGPEVQELLLPLRFRPEDEAAEALARHWQDYAPLGVRLRPAGDGAYDLEAVPLAVAGLEKTVVDFVSRNVRPVADLEKDLYASVSCRAAVMDGDPLDPATARDLLRRTFQLEHARCPHGRPIWTVLTREELFTRVGRLV